MDRKKRCGKKHGAASVIQIFLQIFRRIYAEKFDFESSVFLKFTVDHIIFIETIMNTYKGSHLKIQMRVHFRALHHQKVLPGNVPSLSEGSSASAQYGRHC